MGYVLSSGCRYPGNAFHFSGLWSHISFRVHLDRFLYRLISFFNRILLDPSAGLLCFVDFLTFLRILASQNYRRDSFGYLFRHLAISGLLAVDIFRFLEGLSNQALRHPTVPVLLVLRLLLFSSAQISIRLRLAVPSLIAIAFSVIVLFRYFSCPPWVIPSLIIFPSKWLFFPMDFLSVGGP